MKESEAIKWLRDMQNPMISEAELYCAETYYGSGKMVFPEPEDYVFETAINALEKQEKIKEAFEMWKAKTGGYYGADDETLRFISTLNQILRSDEE